MPNSHQYSTKEELLKLHSIS